MYVIQQINIAAPNICVNIIAPNIRMNPPTSSACGFCSSIRLDSKSEVKRNDTDLVREKYMCPPAGLA